MHFHLAELAHDHSQKSGLLAAFAGIEALQRAQVIAHYGNDDLAEPVEVMFADHQISHQREVIWLVALAGEAPADAPTGRYGLRLLGGADAVAADEVVGFARLILPLLDNLTSVNDILVTVAEPWRRRGLGRVLATTVEKIAAQRNRSILQGYVDTHRATTAEGLRPSQGDHVIAANPGTIFATAMGYRLVQGERCSVQHLAGQHYVAPNVDGYQLVSWAGATPDRYLHRIAELQRTMSVDIPLGEMSAEEESWDAARVRARDAEIAATSELLVTLAIHLASGEAAGFTELNRMHAKPSVVFQWNTLVARAHRGHELGLALKQANLAQLATHWPDAERVHTWNASENDHMWAINKQLGYQTVSIDSAWQKELSRRESDGEQA